jgi:hypothetical protein
MYLDFWPLVAQAWNKIGIRPTLALIEDKKVEIDESLGDVIRFKPIEGISAGFQAQVIRLFLPLFFENDVSLTSDIDILPLNKGYFVDRVKQYDNDCFIVYRNNAYQNNNRIAMCYTAAKGKIYKEIFNIKTIEDIPKVIKKWAKIYNQNPCTDEILLSSCVKKWESLGNKCIKLKDLIPGKRIDRSNWKYDINLLKEGYYIDSHMLRPFKKFKSEINTLAQAIGLEVEILDKTKNTSFPITKLLLTLAAILVILISIFLLKTKKKKS